MVLERSLSRSFINEPQAEVGTSALTLEIVRRWHLFFPLPRYPCTHTQLFLEKVDIK